MKFENKKFEELLTRISKLKETNQIDLSTEEDLTLAIMNLISLEEHFFFTGAKTEKPEYFDLLGEIRQVRKELLAKIMDKNEGETWCLAKHLLATTMRLIEVGTKLHQDNKKKEAQEMFNQAYKIYSLFWGLRLKLIDTQDIKKIAEKEKPWTLKDIVNKLVDCCEE